MTLRPFSSTLQANYRDVFQTPGAPEVIDDNVPVLGVVAIQNNYDANGSQQVRLNGLPSPAASGNLGTQTLKSYTAVGTAAAATIGTVTTGKTFYLFTVVASGTAADQVQILTSTDTLIGVLRPPANDSRVINSAVPLASYASGSNIRFLAAATTRVEYFGYEQ